jgi:chromosome segregation ATPase
MSDIEIQLKRAHSSIGGLQTDNQRLRADLLKRDQNVAYLRADIDRHLGEKEMLAANLRRALDEKENLGNQLHAANNALTALLLERDALKKGIEELRLSHAVIEDCWYSCPESGECCDRRETTCNCGANKHNAKIDLLLGIISKKAE